MKKIIYTLLIMAVLIGVFGIGSTVIGTQTRTSPVKPKVAASIYPLYDIVRTISGDKVETVTILPVGGSPHTFDPSPGDVKRIAGAKTLFIIGHALDDWAVTTAWNAGVSHIVTVDRGIRLIADSNHPQEANPHYFLSPLNAKIIAATVRDTLSAEFPQWRQDFTANYARFASQIDMQYRSFSEKFNAVPDKNIATFHDAWSYFARDYGLTVAAVFEEFPGKDPGPQYINTFQQTILNKHLRVVFAEPQLSLDVLRPVADDLHITIGILDPLGGSAGRTTLLQLLSYNSTVILQSLEHK